MAALCPCASGGLIELAGNSSLCLLAYYTGFSAKRCVKPLMSHYKFLLASFTICVFSVVFTLAWTPGGKKKKFYGAKNKDSAR